MNHLKASTRVLVALLALFASLPTAAGQNPSPYDIGWHVVGSGAQSRNSCFILSGTANQPAPGYSSDATYALLAGFWSAFAAITQDEIFFSGFEGCTP